MMTIKDPNIGFEKFEIDFHADPKTMLVKTPETEEEFVKRFEEGKARGVCVFRDDANREFILDIIDEYMDIIDSLSEGEFKNG